MKIVEGFKMRQLGNEYIIVGESIKLVNFNKMIVLNASAAYLWESVEGKDFTVDDLDALLVEKYGIDTQTAAVDAASIARSWVECGIVEG